MLRKLYSLGYVGYLLLLILALIFYKERTIFTDNAYHLFEIIERGGFAFQNYRYGAVFTQFVPLAGTWLSLSLNGILIAYSVCFVVYYAICYFICGTVFKNYQLALALLLFNILFAGDTFFWMLSELPQGVAFMMVVLSYLSTKATNKPTVGLYVFTFFATAAIIIFFHPLMMFPFLFVVAFFYLDDAKHINKNLLRVIIVFFVFVFVLKKVVFTTTYERNAENIGRRVLNGLFHFFDLFSNKKFLENSLSKYFWIPVVFVATSVFYLSGRKWVKLALYCSAVFGYLLLINLTYSGSDVAQFYIENLYLPLGVFLAIPLLYDLLPLLDGRKNIAYALLLLMIISVGFRIGNISTFYTARLDWKRTFLEKNGDNKLLIAQTLMPMDTVILSWATPYEFWLLSTVEQGATASVTIIDNVDSQVWGANRRKSFLPTWGIYNYDELPSRYFKFKDTSTVYQVLR